MITFKSPEDLARFPPEDPAFSTVEDLIDRLQAVYRIKDLWHFQATDACAGKYSIIRLEVNIP